MPSKAEGSTARGSLRDSVSLADIDTEDFSQSETVGFTEEALEQRDRHRTQAKNDLQFFGEVTTHHVVTDGDYLETKTVNEATQCENRDQCQRAMKAEVKALQDNKT